MSYLVSVYEQLGRVGGFALLDLGLIVAAAALLAKTTDLNFLATLTILWTVGEAFHLAAGVKTPITALIKKE